MSSNPVKRKLSAILAADAVGYSRMMAADEEGTLKTLSAHRAVIDGIIEFHEGRIVGTAGDSVLAEFGSPVEAVRCAVEVQDALRTRNNSLPEDKRLMFRVGVNLGDVMVKGSDLLGDGVNVAARLEGIAEPEGICISASVYDLIRGKLDLGFVDIGEQNLKNIEHPIHVYRVAREGAVPPGTVRKQRRKAGQGLAAGVGALAVAAVAAAYVYLDWLPEQRRAEEARIAAAETLQRAKTEAEVARATAEVDAAKRKAEVELAAAVQARDAAQRDAAAARTTAAKAVAEKDTAEKLAASAGTKPAATSAAAVRRNDDVWTALLACEPFEGLSAFTSPLRAWVLNGEVALQRGAPGEPGSFTMRGTPDANGHLVLIGNGLTGLGSKRVGRPIPAHFEGSYQAGSYEVSGTWGRRPCTVTLSHGG